MISATKAQCRAVQEKLPPNASAVACLTLPEVQGRCQVSVLFHNCGAHTHRKKIVDQNSLIRDFKQILDSV